VSVFAQFAVNGIVAGSVYALIALGFAMIFTASRVFHFAHGGVYTLAAFAGYTALVTFKLGIVAGFLAAIIVAAAIGVLINIFLYEPMKAGGVSPLVAMISSFGVLIIITHMTAMVWGSNPVVLSRGGQTTVYRLGSVYTTDAQLTIIGFAATLAIALWVFFRHMRLGIAIRAMGNDSELAEVVGMPARRLRRQPAICLRCAYRTLRSAGCCAPSARTRPPSLRSERVCSGSSSRSSSFQPCSQPPREQSMCIR
jgi:branched-chain amino acid transport system permease protein